MIHTHECTRFTAALLAGMEMPGDFHLPPLAVQAALAVQEGTRVNPATQKVWTSWERRC